MKHLIMGTAGHIDHGKTALIKALTDIDCDTHPDEQLRGITINLGFAHLDFPDGSSIGIVDVPGHIDFINTMVAGAYGIDMAILVVAADSGIMPQTIEHLSILDILGVQSGVIVITKTDLVDEELLLMAEIEARDAVQGTFLENSPMVCVSAETREGIPQLLDVLAEQCARSQPRKRGNMFRMFVDRIFTVPGFGTVVTGSAMGGGVSTGDSVYLLPGSRELRVRRMERHGREVASVMAGDRISMNLTGLRLREYERGMIVAERPFEATRMLDARITLFQQQRDLHLWTNVTILIGTFHAPARIHLLDHDSLSGGDNAVVQLHLEKSCTVLRGDRFIIRSLSGERTLGGGEIIDTDPLHHRRRPPTLLRQLHELADGGLKEAIAAYVRKSVTPVSCARLAEVFDAREEELCEDLFTSLPEDISWLGSTRNGFLMMRLKREKLERLILRKLSVYHARNPLDERGKSFEELAALYEPLRNSESDGAMRIILKDLFAAGRVASVANTWTEATHRVELTPTDIREIRLVEQYCRSCGMHTPLLSEMHPYAKSVGIEQQKLHHILRLLTARGVLFHIEGNYIHHEIVARCRTALIAHLSQNHEGITVAGFRDLVKGNRKICLLLLAQYDSEAITERKDDVRLLTDKGYHMAHNSDVHVPPVEETVI